MKIGADGLALLHYFEQCRLRAYADPRTGAEPWTCGWGDRSADIGPSTAWTQEEADTRFVRRLTEDFEPLANRAVTVAVTQRQFDAFTSILYNVGPGRPDLRGVRGKDGILVLRSGQASTLLRKLNESDFGGASAEFPKWISAGSNVERGLRRRRAAERAVFDGVAAAAAIAAAKGIA